MNSDGKLNSPESRWGGIMREVLTSDFETANIQYVEFWVMDPFVDNPQIMREGICILTLGIFLRIFCATQEKVLKTDFRVPPM